MPSLPVRAALAVLCVVPLAPAQAEVGKPAPAVELSTLLNAPVPFATLEELRGSAVLVEFWATWCGPCRAVMPKLNEWHGAYAERGLVVLGLAFNEGEDKVKPFLDQQQLAYPIGIDPRAGGSFGVRGIPAAFLLDPEGTIVWAGHPARLTSTEIEAALVGARPFGARLTGQLEPVQQLLDREQKGRALATLELLMAGDKLDAAVRDVAALVKIRLEREATRGLALATPTAGQAPPPPFAVAWALVQGAAQFAGHSQGKAFAAALQDFEQKATGASEQAALRLARELQAAAERLAKGDLDGAAKGYAAVVAGAGDCVEATRLAERGLARLAARRAPPK